MVDDDAEHALTELRGLSLELGVRRAGRRLRVRGALRRSRRRHLGADLAALGSGERGPRLARAKVSCYPHRTMDPSLERRLTRAMSRARDGFPDARRGRSRDGLRERRQGQLHDAAHAARAAEARADSLRARRREHRPGPSRLPRRSPAQVHARRGLRLHDDRGGHVLDRHGQDPRGQDVLLALLAPPPRDPLSRREGDALHEDRARAPSRRHPADAAPEPVLRRSARGDAAEAHGAGRARRHPPARVLRGGGHRRFREGKGVSDPAVRSLRLAGQPAAQDRRPDDQRPRGEASRHQGGDARGDAERPSEPPARQGSLARARPRGRARGREATGSSARRASSATRAPARAGSVEG